MNQTIAFIGGGNMASAIIGGLIQQGHAPDAIQVIEPFEPARDKLQASYGITAQAAPDARLAEAGMVVWAVKPQTFQEAALQARTHSASALHLSVAAGIRSDSIASWLGTERVIRCMPNTPALIGKGMTALYARPGVGEADRHWASAVIATTGQYLWLTQEAQLDAVTALSGSGPAYVFYFLETMRNAGVAMGLPAEQAYQLAVATFLGAGALAQASTESPEVLRERVTSKGGTTYAAISSMDESGVSAHFAKALHAARDRAEALGDAFGAS